MEPIIVDYKSEKHNEICCYKENDLWYVSYWFISHQIDGPFATEGEAKQKAEEILKVGKELIAKLQPVEI